MNTQYVIRDVCRLLLNLKILIISSDENGNTIRVKDVARVELGGLYYSVTSKVNGQPAVMMMVTQTAGSNATQIVKDIKKVIDEQRTLLPPGVKSTICRTLQSSSTRLWATLFIRCLRHSCSCSSWFTSSCRTSAQHLSRLLRCLCHWSVRSSSCYVFGFSLNLLTLSALVLAIAIVVDDA